MDALSLSSGTDDDDLHDDLELDEDDIEDEDIDDDLELDEDDLTVDDDDDLDLGDFGDDDF